MNYGKAVLEGRDKGNKYWVECPYCYATNVKKNSTTSKVVNTALFGIFGNKTYHNWIKITHILFLSMALF